MIIQWILIRINVAKIGERYCHMANSTARIGIHHCGMVAAQSEWLFREQPISDVGIDAHMEMVDTTGKVKQLLALQIKSGESWFKEIKNDYIVFRDINERQYNYWTTNSLPCILVLFNPNDSICIWQKLTTDTIKKTKKGSGKGYSVKVPLNQVFLDTTSNKRLLEFSTLPDNVINYNFLLSQISFMKIIQDGGQVKLYSKEWVNKSSGRGEVQLIVDIGGRIIHYEYPYFFPFTQYVTVFPNLFPWAIFSIDEHFYEESDRILWHEYHCYYDKENDEWYNVGESFEGFRQKLNPMRSINDFGEVAEYMFILSLNELGKSFLNVYNYISQNQVYVRARPQKSVERESI